MTRDLLALEGPGASQTTVPIDLTPETLGLLDALDSEVLNARSLRDQAEGDEVTMLERMKGCHGLSGKAFNVIVLRGRAWTAEIVAAL